MGACALTLEGSLRELRHTGWGPKDGAPDAITSITQTSDGYLWISSLAGLVRFDGLRFERFELPRDPRLSSLNVNTLFAPDSGGLWIGFSFGGAAFLKDGKLTVYAERDGLAPGTVQGIVQDHDGTVWAATTTALSRLDGSRWKKVDAEAGYPEEETMRMMLDSAGTLWAATKTEVRFLPRGEKVFRQTGVRIQTETRAGLAESPGGVVWLLSDLGLRPLRQNANPRRQTPSTRLGLVFDRDGAMWVKAGGSLLRIADPKGDGTRWWLPDATPFNSMSEKEGLYSGGGNGPMLEDREGNLWSASGHGVDRFTERNVAPFAPPKGDPRKLVFQPELAAIAAGDDGALWLVGRSPVFKLLGAKGGEVTRIDRVSQVSCALRAEDGSLWFGGPHGVWRYASGSFEAKALPAGTDPFEVQAMAVDRAGHLWISIVRRGVYRLADGVWTAYGGIQALPRLTAVTLSSDAAGRIWFGYTEGRMAVLDGSSVQVFFDQDGPPVGNVTAIYGKRSRLWAGGEFGLAFFDGKRFRAITLDSRLPLQKITGIIETAGGDLWLNASVGIVHVTGAEALRAAADPDHPVQAEVFGGLDGVEGSSSRLRPLPTALEGTDGRLWFLTNTELYAISPERIHRNPLPPPVWVQSVTADGKQYAPVNGLKLPENATAVRIDYVGLSLTLAEKVRYRYKLDSVDKTWQEAEGRRQAYYTNLAPGRHRFQVIASNNDGVWNEAGATLDFVIPPTFVQTGWFVALCAAAAAALVWMLTVLRARQLARRMQDRLGERVAERERIARELHDTLLQSTGALMLQVHAAATRVAPGDPARALLDDALMRADEALAEGRDRIQDLRVSADVEGDLAESLAKVGQEIARGEPIQCSVVVEGSARELKAGIRDEAHRIGREALINAFQHAKASLIEVQVIYAEDGLRVRIRDDGVGFQGSALEGGTRRRHWGLPGMRERAERIGAQLDVWSRPEAGTEIELRVPAAAAYREPARGLRWLATRLAGKDSP
jgi:signal transduction histidine kinase/ligand-binding sensor domain-containing protein